MEKAKEFKSLFSKKGIRVHIDDRDVYTPGWKYNHWELKGVPIRIELGPNDFKNREVKIVKRYNGEKLQLKWEELENKVILMFH